MSSKGNIHLEHDKGLEAALVRLKEGEQSGPDFARFCAWLEWLLESATDRAVRGKGEVTDRALGAMGALRLELAVIRDADGLPYKGGGDGEPPDLFPEEGDE